ncbi:uncharacterized protein [Montipora capricornis]|uniref:uncharacterized protein isoform X1 n=1 Tax=Montipora capricornis TaxID=246305 RepID=UPI0035F20EF4
MLQAGAVLYLFLKISMAIFENFFHGTQNIASQMMTAVTSHLFLPELINETPPGSAKDILYGQTDRTNRTCLRDELYPIGKLKEEIPSEPCEDDLMLSTRVESISSIKFFNYLQLGDAVFYSQAYREITIRNHHTDAYAQEEEIRYQQTEVFLMVVKDVDSVMTCAAAPCQMPKEFEQWKTQLEESEDCSFVKSIGDKEIHGVKIIYFQCNRSGAIRSATDETSPRKRRDNS